MSILPDVTLLPGAPPPGVRVRSWRTAWTVVWFRLHGQWRVGVVRQWVCAPSGEWVAKIVYGEFSGQTHWTRTVWAAYDPQLIMPVPAGPSGQQ